MQIKALEATSSASQDKEADWDRRVTENSTLAHVLAEEVRLLKENGNSLVGRVDSLLAANKQAGLKDMPDRIQGLEDKVNTLHREQAQLPSWVKRQSQMVGTWPPSPVVPNPSNASPSFHHQE